MFELVRRNRNRSFWLVTVMGLLLAATGFGAFELMAPGAGGIGIGVALCLGVGMFLVSFYAGNSVLLAAAGAHELNRDAAPQLYNIVEEMVIASGLGQMPKLYLIESNAANAFATGRNPEVAAVAVTEGLLNLLNRDQLQAVIAHELAHVKNRDILYMTLLAVMAGAIGLLAELISRYFFYGGGRKSRSSNTSNGQAQLILAVVGIALLIVGPLVARLVFFAASRTREYLADAQSAIFTRNPEALAQALEKISGNLSGARLPVPKVAQPMLIVGAALFETHPPIDKRIGILRALAGGGGELSYARYAQAFARTLGKSPRFLPTSALSERAVPCVTRPTLSAADSAAQVRPTGLRREALNAVKRAAGYEVLACRCGATIKIPQSYPGRDTLRCLACGQNLVNR